MRAIDLFVSRMSADGGLGGAQCQYHARIINGGKVTRIILVRYRSAARILFQYQSAVDPIILQSGMLVLSMYCF